MKPKAAQSSPAIPSTAAELAEAVRKSPFYVETWGKEPRTTTRRRHVVEYNGIAIGVCRDKAWQTARFLVRRGYTSRAVVLLVTTTTTREELHGYQDTPGPCAHGPCQREAAPGGRYCKGHAAIHATHGKNGRPELQAVTP